MNSKSLNKFLLGRPTATLIVFIALVLIFSLFTRDHVFIGQRNIAALGRLFPDLGVITLGVGLLMIAGEFDLSVAAVLPFTSYIFARLLMAGSPPFWALLIAVVTGGALGLLNGFIVVKTKMPSFIVTLATLMFWRGVLFVWSRMMPLSVGAFIDRGSSFELALNGTVGGFFPIQTVWFVIFAVILGVVLHFHRFGNWVYATGDNRDAARAMGIRTDHVKIICFIIVGLLCGFSGGLQTVRLGSFAATQGIGFELRAISACVVGALSLRGGIGTMGGIVLGTLTIPILDNGLILMGVPIFGITAFIGLATILFVLLSSYTERRFR
ncbi:MAG TPA: ABC transporter permease [Atribacteraceae bacterium]|nr:ABC transporter permease [Atribacteraceae bacterium]